MPKIGTNFCKFTVNLLIQFWFLIIIELDSLSLDMHDTVLLYSTPLRNFK